MTNDLLTREQAAEMLHLSPRTLANLYSLGRGPKLYGKPGRRVFYHRDEIMRWVRENGGRQTRQ